MTNKREQFIKNIIIISIIIFSFIPTLIYFLNTASDQVYTFSPSSSLDYTTYLYKMKIGVEGGWIYHNYYVFDDNPNILIFLFYTILGHISKFLHIDMIIVYLIARVIFAYLLLNIFYKIIKLFNSNHKTSLIILLIAGTFTCGGRINEFELLANISKYPHAIVSIYLYFLITYIFFKCYKEGQDIPLVKSSLLLLCLTLVHPYMSIPLNITYVFLFYKKFNLKNNIKNLIVFNAFWLIYAIYLTYYFMQPSYNSWMSQSGNESSAVVYGVLLIMVGFPFIYLFVFKNKKIDYCLKVWVYTYFVCSLLPFSFQRRMLEGVVTVFLMIILITLFNHKINKVFQTLIIFNLILSYIGGIFLYTYLLSPTILKEEKQNITAIYYSKDQQDIFNWINQEKIRNQKILANMDISLNIPAFTYNKVYIGHYAESYNLNQKRTILQNINTIDDLKDFIKNRDVNYIISYKDNVHYSEKNKKTVVFEILKDKNIKNSQYRMLYENKSYAIYKTE